MPEPMFRQMGLVRVSYFFIRSIKEPRNDRT